jgi:hypothetical protein
MHMQRLFFQAPILAAIVYFSITYGEEWLNFGMQIMQFYAGRRHPRRMTGRLLVGGNCPRAG